MPLLASRLQGTTFTDLKAQFATEFGSFKNEVPAASQGSFDDAWERCARAISKGISDEIVDEVREADIVLLQGDIRSLVNPASLRDDASPGSHKVPLVGLGEATQGESDNKAVTLVSKVN